ncbi:MAG: DUF4350 domain-containing protein [Archangiaceae bacterium]|nr:DUF4350 domain-containing protein [Archangiaceae bacterium]
MKRSVWLYAALLALALVAGLSAPSTAPESPVPSADNPGAHGLKLLRAWLTQTGRDVRLLRDFELPPELKTLVIAAPSGHAVSADERAKAEAFVMAGGTLVYLRPRRARLQHELDDWLELASGPSPARDLQGRDVLGVSQPVQFLRGVKTVRVLADETVVSSLPQAVPLAGSLLWAPLGRGGVFIGAGADLAEGARLELDDNAAFWAGLPAPLAFDELHQAPLPRPNLSANLVAVLLQLSFCALCFLLAFGRRLGPPRPTLTEQHRSSLEYVRSMAALNRQARVEPELAHELCARLARLLERPVGELPVNADEVRTPEEFLALAQRCADLEAPNRSLSSRT